MKIMFKQGVKVSFIRTIGQKKCSFEGVVLGIKGKRTVRITRVTSPDCFTDKTGVYNQDISNVTLVGDFVTQEMTKVVKHTLDMMFEFYRNHPELVHSMGYRISKVNEY